VHYKDRTMTIGDTIYKEGDWISLNGSSGMVYESKIKTMDPQLRKEFAELQASSFTSKPTPSLGEFRWIGGRFAP
jgi:pyruvate,orthophosphate dikinase